MVWRAVCYIGIKMCDFIFPNGTRCQNPATSANHKWCFYHDEDREKDKKEKKKKWKEDHKNDPMMQLFASLVKANILPESVLEDGILG